MSAASQAQLLHTLLGAGSRRVLGVATNLRAVDKRLGSTASYVTSSTASTGTKSASSSTFKRSFTPLATVKATPTYKKATTTTTSSTTTPSTTAPSSTSSEISKPASASLFSTSTSVYNIGKNVNDSGIKSLEESNTPANSTGNGDAVDWTQSYSGLGLQPFPLETAQILTEQIDPEDVEVKPEGLLYLPEIKYRRILNRAFGPGGWGLAPRSETIITPKMITREYALIAHGRLVAIARGEQDYFDPSGIPTATEGCKSNAMMRCCKDLGVASELWDPRFIREFKKKHTRQVMAEHVSTKKKKYVWIRKDESVAYPFKEVK